MGLKELITTHWAWQLGQSVGSGDADRGQISTLITVVTIGLVAVIGILVYDQVDSSLTITDGNLSNSASNVTDGFGDAMDLVPVVLLVLVASLVIAVIQQF